MKHGILITAALMLSSFAASAQTASTTASVNIENYALDITKTQDLNFGSITPSASTNGTMTLSPNGLVSTGGGVISRSGSGYSPAAYTINGVPAASFSVTIAPTVVTLSGPRGTLTVSDFAINQATPIVLDSSTGTAYFTVGATLFVNAGQLPGYYTGTFDVTVAYN
jgi:Domain of unknown function (DUF4402)